jgi:hypothetical protein
MRRTWTPCARSASTISRSDVIHGAAFFNWAKRLMLSLGEPRTPAQA